MKSGRGKLLKLTAADDDKLSIVRIDNHVCLSDQLVENYQRNFIRFKKNTHGKNSRTGGDEVIYPVMFTAEVEKNQIVIPPGIRRDLNIRLGDKVDCLLDLIPEKKWVNINKINFVIQRVRDVQKRGGVVDVKDLDDAVRGAMGFGEDYPLHNGQVIAIPFHSVKLELRVEALEPDSFALSSHGGDFFCLAETTKIRFVNECALQFKLNGESAADQSSGLVAEIPLDFTDKGVGGLKKEISHIIRSIFYTRTMNQTLLDAYGVKKHAKGMLLYGPPGNGKTFIAKCISELFTKEAVRIIEGPELKNSYYGATQQNLSNLFIDARNNPDKLYVYVFDEIDGMCVTRGSDSSVSTSNNNDLVSTMLGIFDGVDSPQNIIIIGTTNRKELLDPALLRAGRMETHIYIGLPDEMDRLQALQVHTKNMQLLGDDVDLPVLARLTKNYSRAELAMIVDVARKYAMSKNFDTKDDALHLRDDVKTIAQAAKVTQQHFILALREVRPMFGVEEACLANLPAKFLIYNNQLKETIDHLQLGLDCLTFTKNIKQLNCLISGKPGTGKSSLAMYLAMASRFNHVQLLTANKLLPHPLSKQIDIMDEIFARARQSAEPSVIILDNLENIIEATPDYAQYNNRLRLKLHELLHDAAAGDNKVLVIATTESREFMQRIGMAVNFSESEELAPVRFALEDIKQCAEIISGLAASLDIKIDNKQSRNHAGIVIDIPVKDLIYQLRKYASANAINKLDDFLLKLPVNYRVEVRNEGQKSPSMSMFRRSVSGM